MLLLINAKEIGFYDGGIFIMIKFELLELCLYVKHSDQVKVNS